MPNRTLISLIKAVICVAAFFPATIMPAQTLPALEKDKTVSTGSLTNDITYYLATNSTMKGTADFALVRKGKPDTAATRNELSSLSHFNRTAPIKFLSRKGIGCRQDGYAAYRPGATVFRFDSVPVFDKAATDTTLLMLFDLIAAEPAEYAVILAGDLDPDYIKERMNVFSLMVPARNAEKSGSLYEWKGRIANEFIFNASDNPSVTVTFHSERVPAEQMGTIVPFTTELYSRSLAKAVEWRLKETLSDRGVQARKIDVSYVGSAETEGDELFTVKAETSEQDLLPATMTIASVLSEVASRGVGMMESGIAIRRTLDEYSSLESNGTWVERCISNYLYGSDLSSGATKADFFKSRNVPPEVERKFFNDYAYALLGPSSNVSVEWTGDEANYDEWLYQMAFKSTWDGISSLNKPVYSWNTEASDTTKLWTDKRKVKLKSSLTEPVSGGQIWTFSNGMKVIYKQMESSESKRGRFTYSLMLRGGYSEVRNLKKGEGAFFADALEQSDIAGMSGEDFFRLLESCGVKMNCEVSSSDMRLEGSAPASRLDLTLKALLSVANFRMPDQEAYGQWIREERASLDNAYLDSLLYPDYVLSDVKTRSGLMPSTMERADNYFNTQFSKSNDGMLMIVGDLPAETVQKSLCQYLGGFKTSKSLPVRVPVNQANPGYGLTTYVREGDEASVTVAMASMSRFTAENQLAFKVAGLIIKRALNGVMAEQGYHVELSDKFTAHPQEAMELIFTCFPVNSPDGMPEGFGDASKGTMKALLAVRAALDKVLSEPVNVNEMNACKDYLTSLYSAALSDPLYYSSAVLMRYSVGKDVLTDYETRLKAVNAANVQSIFNSLSEGRRIEYVVKP